MYSYSYLLSGTMKPELSLSEHIAPHLNARRGWLAVAGLVTAYELTCPDGELLSEGVDRALQKHPVLTTLAIGYTAAHLANILPEEVDLFSKVFR